MRHASSLQSALVACLVFACACSSSVDVVRVKPNDYQTKGFRYYLPRPYIVVKKDFPLGGEACFVRGKLDGDRITEIDATAVPASIRRLLGWEGVERGQIGVGRITMFIPAAAAAAPQTEPSGAGLASAASSVTNISPAAWLGKSKATPETLQVDDAAFTISLVVGADNGFESIDDVDLELGVVPLAADGQPDFAAFIPCAKTASPTFKKATELTYGATGLRKDIKGGPLFKLAARFEGAQTATPKETKSYLAVASNVGLTVVGAPRTSTAQHESEKKVEVKSPSSAKATISGDPTTPVVNDISEHFDLMYLPDFDEQYAVQMDPGLGEATLNLGLENGWLVESSSVTLDNKELGNFIFHQIDRFTSLAADIAKAYSGLIPVPVSLGVVEKSAFVDEQKVKWVLLKITYSIEALPGVYPLLKPGESKTPASGDTTYLQLPAPPFTAIAFNVRRAAMIELATAGSP
jgi:hypothetical protein